MSNWGVQQLNFFDGQENIVAGIDEAGRGPLAGPVVAAAVILPETHTIVGLDDSKKLNEAKREKLYEYICQQAHFGVGIVPHDVIDKINILQATFRAMREAVSSLPLQPHKLMIDGKQIIPNHHLEQRAIIGGDGIEPAISAASIVAKVTRDRMMVEYHKEYPLYDFAKHKGYGTKDHRDTLKKMGPCDIHRRGFIKGILGG